MNMLINIIAFKIGWLSSVVGASSDMPALGPAVVLAVIAIHLIMVSQPSSELLLIILTGAVGAVADSLMINAGWLAYPTGTFVAGFSPYWIIAMWMLFATTFNMSFRWLQSKMLLAAALGAVFGPLSYYFGEKIGAVTLQNFSASMIALAVAWGALMPALLILARRLNRVPVQGETSRIK
jgi:hypothetical protein